MRWLTSMDETHVVLDEQDGQPLIAQSRDELHQFHLSWLLRPDRRLGRGGAGAAASPGLWRSRACAAVRMASHGAYEPAYRDRPSWSRRLRARCCTERSSLRARLVWNAPSQTRPSSTSGRRPSRCRRGHEGEQADVLERPGDAELGDPVGWKSRDGHTVEPDLSGRDREEPGDAVEGSRLAPRRWDRSSTGSPAIEAEADVGHREESTESLGHAVEFESATSGDPLHGRERLGLSRTLQLDAACATRNSLPVVAAS